MSDHTPISPSSPEELVKDQAWAMLVMLYQDDFTAEEIKEAKLLLENVTKEEGWDKLEHHLQVFRNDENLSLPHYEEPEGLTEQSRANIMKVALNIAANNAQQQASSNQKATSIFDLLYYWSKPISVFAVMTLALIGLWSQQEDIAKDELSNLKTTLAPSIEATKSEEKIDLDQSASPTNMLLEKSTKSETVQPSPKSTEFEAEEPLIKIKSDDQADHQDEEVQVSDAIESNLLFESPSKKPSARKKTRRPKKSLKRRTKKRRRVKSKPRKNKPKVSTKSVSKAKKKTYYKKRARSKNNRVAEKAISNLPAPSTKSGSAYSQRQAPPQSSAAPQGVNIAKETAPANNSGSVDRSSQQNVLKRARKGNEKKPNRSNDDVVEPSGPPPPWNDAIRLWAKGEQKAALSQLMRWIERNRYHRQRSTAIRLATSWANMLNDDSTLARLEEFKNQRRKRRKSRSSDNSNYMTPSQMETEAEQPQNSLGF